MINMSEQVIMPMHWYKLT